MSDFIRKIRPTDFKSALPYGRELSRLIRGRIPHRKDPQIREEKVEREEIDDSLIGKEIRKFYKKDILREYNFIVKIDGPISPNIFDVVNVEIPTYNFQGIQNPMGPGTFQKSFSVMTMPQDAHVRITFEEDDKGTVIKFIHKLQRKIINEDGFYNPIRDQYISRIEVYQYNTKGEQVATWTFYDCYYLNTNNPTLSYTGNDSVKYSVDFGVDRIGFDIDEERMDGISTSTYDNTNNYT